MTKDYLTSENDRNRKWRDLYTRILHVAFGEQDEVVIGHHLTFLNEGQADEIPSADCLIFDHDIMERVFGEHAQEILSVLAMTPCESRDAQLAQFFEAYHKKAA